MAGWLGGRCFHPRRGGEQERHNLATVTDRSGLFLSEIRLYATEIEEEAGTEAFVQTLRFPRGLNQLR